MNLKEFFKISFVLTFFLLSSILFSCGQKEDLKLVSQNFSEKNLYKNIEKSFKEKKYEDVIAQAEVYLKYFPYSPHAQDVFYMLAFSYKKFIFGPEYDPYFAEKLYNLSKKYLLLYPNGKYKKEFQKFKAYAKNILFNHEYIIVKEEIKRNNYYAALDRLYNLCRKKKYKDEIYKHKKEIKKLFKELKPKAISQINKMIKEREEKIREYEEKIQKDEKHKNIYLNWISLLKNEIKYLENKKKEVESLSCSL